MLCMQQYGTRRMVGDTLRHDHQAHFEILSGGYRNCDVLWIGLPHAL